MDFCAATGRTRGDRSRDAEKRNVVEKESNHEGRGARDGNGGGRGLVFSDSWGGKREEVGESRDVEGGSEDIIGGVVQVRGFGEALCRNFFEIGRRGHGELQSSRSGEVVVDFKKLFNEETGSITS